MRFLRGTTNLVIALTFLLTTLAPAAVSAQTAGEGLEISPPLKELNVNPGQTTTFQIQLRNVTTTTLTATPSVEDFIAKGEEGQPKLLLNNSTEKSPYSLKDWIQPVETLTLKPQAIETATVTMVVPQNASPGGHYGVVRFSAAPAGSSGTSVSLSASIGTLILANVSGKIITKASLIDFYTSQNGKKSTFFQNGPVNFTERVNNTGNVHIKPIGTVRITNSFGKEVAVLSINHESGNILPQSIRRFDEQLAKNHLFGHYKAEANIQYSGQNLTGTVVFWVLPVKQVAATLLAVIILILLLIFFFKRYNRYIIQKANKK